MKARSSSGRRQRGMTLIVALVVLLLVMLVVVSGVRSSNVELHVAGNMQVQKEAEGAAQQGIETVVGTAFATLTPSATVVNVDIDNDGVSDYAVSVPPPNCVAVQPIKTADLNITNPDDASCEVSGSVQNSGIVTSGGAGATGNSLCSNAVWDISATAAPVAGNSAAAVTTHQGIAVRVPVGSNC
ncbi:MAG: pilus assembly protein [Burkholderiales bacterium]|nr:pilus assembly protein [Burkholderiales bacterium]MDE2452889.1 pilus assembly protein [Burkholderiales bacterium]